MLEEVLYCFIQSLILLNLIKLFAGLKGLVMPAHIIPQSNLLYYAKLEFSIANVPVNLIPVD